MKSATTAPKVSILSLIREKSCDGDYDQPKELRNRGRVVMFSINIKKFEDRADEVERDLAAMEALLEAAGWDNDTCPNYTDGVSCGFWVAPDDVAAFRKAYMVAKAELPAYLDAQQAKAVPVSQPEQKNVTATVFRAVNEGFLGGHDFFAVYDEQCYMKGANGSYLIAPFMYPGFFVEQSRMFTVLADEQITIYPAEMDLLFESPESFRSGHTYKEPAPVSEFQLLDDTLSPILEYTSPTIEFDATGITVSWEYSCEPFSVRAYEGTNFDGARALIAQLKEEAYKSVSEQIKHEQRIEAAAELHYQGFYYGGDEALYMR